MSATNTQTSVSANTAAPPRDPLGIARWVPASAKRILDCAAGDGTLGAHLKSVSERSVVGIEKDPTRAAVARNLLDEVICGDQYSFELPWADASFDCAVAAGLLPKLRDPAPFMAGTFRVLRPGSLFAVTVPNIQYYEHFLMLVRGRWQLQDHGALARDHIRFFTAFELVMLFERAGFGQVRVGILDSAPAEAFPLDATGHVHYDDLDLGPFDAEEHKAFLAREYVVLGVKPV